MRAMRNYAGHRLAPWLSHVMVSRQETARQLITPGEIMQLPKKVRYYADKNFTGRVSSPPKLSPDGYGGLSPTVNCVWGVETRSVDDRLYSEAEKTEQDKIASALNSAADDDAGGKDHSPELEALEKEVAKNEPEKTPDVSDEDGFATSVKLGHLL